MFIEVKACVITYPKKVGYILGTLVVLDSTCRTIKDIPKAAIINK
jgi:hypothetical protein